LLPNNVDWTRCSWITSTLGSSPSDGAFSSSSQLNGLIVLLFLMGECFLFLFDTYPMPLTYPLFLPRAAVLEIAGEWGRRRWPRSLLHASSRYTGMGGGCSLFTTLSFTLASCRSSVFGWIWRGGEGNLPLVARADPTHGTNTDKDVTWGIWLRVGVGLRFDVRVLNGDWDLVGNSWQV